jgi:hypothetical protein
MMAAHQLISRERSNARHVVNRTSLVGRSVSRKIGSFAVKIENRDA